jgi:hypothetical protein
MAVAQIDRGKLGDVAAGPCRDNTPQGSRSGGVDGANSSVRVAGAHDAHVKLIWE